MQQVKTNIKRYQEYPGSYTWTDYELLCPCGKIADSLIEEQDSDGDWHCLCPECAKEAEKFIGDLDDTNRTL